MYLLLSIMLSILLGFILLMIGGPVIGGIIAFGIVAGCIFRGLYLLHDIQSRLSNLSPKEDRVEAAYKEYIEKKKAT